MCLSRRYAIVLLVGLLLPSALFACMWDYDTIKMERARFPSTLELITGKFLRHSPEFYQWRANNRRMRLKADPTNLALLDDFAVALDKLGEHGRAIETALATEANTPGRYETAANLGSFYIHAGKLEEGIKQIDLALKINPDAHFGREKYQKLLAEYVLEQRKSDPNKLPLANVTFSNPKDEKKNPSGHEVSVSFTFASFIQPTGRPIPPDETAAAIKGVLGMMKFGKHDSPILLEALGSLLAQDGSSPTDDAKLLATRAYLKASYEVPDGTPRNGYRGMAKRALYMQTSPENGDSQVSLGKVEADFQKELDEAKLWYAELREREISWIREGKNPETEFDKLYDTEPEVSGMSVPDPMTLLERMGLIFLAFLVAGIGVLAVCVHIYRKSRKARVASRTTESDDSFPTDQQ